jgi:hypothetical protein
VLLGSLQALLISDFGPGTAMKIVESLRKDILNATLKSGPEIKVGCSFISLSFPRILVRNNWKEGLLNLKSKYTGC